MATAKVKEEVGPIFVMIQYGDPVVGQVKRSFRIHRDDPLRRIFLDFCDIDGLVYSAIRFLLDGDRIRDTQTPDDLEMADGDIIDAFNEQLGAGGGKMRLGY